VTIDEVRRLAEGAEEHFADGGVFDQIYAPLAGAVDPRQRPGLAGLWACRHRPRVLRRAAAEFRQRLLAATVQCGVRRAGRLGAGALRFPGRRLLDAMVDLPFALPTAVAGIALTALYAGQRLGRHMAGAAGIKVAFTPVGIVMALVFIGLPFVVRTVQPVLETATRELEEAAATLGASRLQTCAGWCCRRCCRPCSPASRWPSRAAWASTAR
jgi:sulfate transport system permease protein